MINLPTSPTAPALGKSSSAISQGYIDSELQPFVTIGGSIPKDPGSLSFAGQARLGRHIFLKTPEEQKRVMSDIKTNRLNQFVNQMLGEGFTRQGVNRLQRGNEFIDINWSTGEYTPGGSTPVSVVSTKSSSSGGDQLAAKFNILQGIESGKIQASASATDKLRSQLGLSAAPEYYDIGGQGYSVSSTNVQAMANQITKSSSGGGSSSKSSSSAPSYANGGLSFSGGKSSSYSNVNVSSNLNKALGTSTNTSSASPYKATTSTVYKTPTPTYTAPKSTYTAPKVTAVQKVTSALSTKLSNSKIGNLTKAVSSLLKKK